MILEIALIVAWIGLIPASAVHIRRSWRNEGSMYTDEPKRWWPGNLASWRAHVRWTAVAGQLGVILMALVVLVAVAGATGTLLTVVILLLGLPAVALVFVAVPLIMLFNKPKWLVPPHLRHQPGRIAEALGDPVRPTPPPRPRGREPKEIFPGHMEM